MILPLNCLVEYHPSFLSEEESRRLFNHLLDIEQLTTMNQITTYDGQQIDLNFGKLMMVDEPMIYDNEFASNRHGITVPWTPEMEILKNKVEALTGHTFEVAVCIYYPDGSSWVDYHADLVSFGDTSYIPSLSLGTERNFLLRENKTKKVYPLHLHVGSLLIMGNGCQEKYEHSLPLDPSCTLPRINITFRKFGFN